MVDTEWNGGHVFPGGGGGADSVGRGQNDIETDE